MKESATKKGGVKKETPKIVKTKHPKEAVPKRGKSEKKQEATIQNEARTGARRKKNSIEEPAAGKHLGLYKIYKFDFCQIMKA